ncbi:glucose-6-phosphate isomerase [Pseudomonadota bacterium]
MEKIHARKQGFYEVIEDEKVVEDIEKFASDSKGKYKNIVVLGIGGSSLGTICLQQSLKHLYVNERSTSPKLHVLDNIDPTLIAEIQDVIEFSSTLFIVVTKSGGTPETISQYLYFRKRIEDNGLSPTDHFLFITDPKKGLLRKIASEEEITSFEVPPNVGGRFSILTPVGLLPAALIGIDIRKLLEGARSMKDSFLSNDTETNLPFILAAMQHSLGQDGKIMNVMIPYSQKLIRFADWYRQLLAESIGKDGIGLTPINALGATDQHSQSQLYNEGPNDKFFIFLKVEDFGTDIKIPSPEEESISYLKGVSFNKLIHTEMEGTIGSLNENKRPNITLTVDKVNAQSLGELLMLFMSATAFLGELYGINAFDQPGVELSKNLTKELLSKR